MDTTQTQNGYKKTEEILEGCLRLSQRSKMTSTRHLDQALHKALGEMGCIFPRKIGSVFEIVF